MNVKQYSKVIIYLSLLTYGFLHLMVFLEQSYQLLDDWSTRAADAKSLQYCFPVLPAVTYVVCFLACELAIILWAKVRFEAVTSYVIYTFGILFIVMLVDGRAENIWFWSAAYLIAMILAYNGYKKLCGICTRNSRGIISFLIHAKSGPDNNQYAKLDQWIAFVVSLILAICWLLLIIGLGTFIFFNREMFLDELR